jgi:hypothetical protein
METDAQVGRKRRDSVAFPNEAEELKKLAEMPVVRLVYFDQANFSISWVVSHAWQRLKDRTDILISGGHRNSIQVLGFLSDSVRITDVCASKLTTGERVRPRQNDREVLHGGWIGPKSLG